MSSILNNPAALSALQALQMTQQSLATVQNQVSTGLKVATAADNSSYWSIAAQLNADSGVVSPKLCHKPSDSAGSLRPDLPQTRYCISE